MALHQNLFLPPPRGPFGSCSGAFVILIMLQDLHQQMEFTKEFEFNLEKKISPEKQGDLNRY